MLENLLFQQLQNFFELIGSKILIRISEEDY